jgi:LuxR family maltose regulon positive regulatory protein
MAGPLLETKLSAPRRREGVVSRARLNDRLSHDGWSRLTLVAAPAGFGKTTQIVDWLATSPVPPAIAWLSLDAGDDDPVAYWTYLVAALQRAAPTVGEQARQLLETTRAPIEGVLTSLLNDVGAMPMDVVLVLDDYHLIESPEIHAGMSFLVDHLPPRLHLVIATRIDPPLPLARLRARGGLVELRAADLRFQPDEAAAYLHGSMGLALTDREIEVLDERTEGWIAALQLAGLSLRGRDDVDGFIAGFAGDDRYIVDYLAEEVLQRQPEELQRFLLQTSILARLTGELCDALTRRTDSRAVLHELDRANLFLVPLDDRRRWYRYHHLFADVLRARLLDEMPDQVAVLHRRASEWHAAAGDRSEAIRHALEGGDVDRAGDLIEGSIADMRKGRQEVTLRGWLEALPPDVLRDRPVLGLTLVGTMMQTGRHEGVDERLREAERWVEERSDGSGGADADAVRRVRIELAMYRAAYALIQGDRATTLVHAQRAIDLSDADEHLGRGAGAALSGLAHWSDGNVGIALERYEEAMASLQQGGYLSDAVGCAITVADLQISLGRPDDAAATYEHGLALATSGDGPPLRGAADMLVGLGDLAREHDDLDRATADLARSRELGDENGLPQYAYRWRLLDARIRLATGDPDGALERLAEAERWHTTDMSPDVRPLAAVRARMWIAIGRPDEVWAWARRQGLSVADDATYLREYELATLGRALVAQASQGRAAVPVAEVMALADRLLVAAEDSARVGSVLDLLTLQALARHAARDVAGALASLTRALLLAEPRGHVRTFLDEGPSMAPLLRLAVKHDVVGPYARRLLRRAEGEVAVAGPRPPLVEPLSERELDVLRLLAGDLDGPAIASELFVSVNTLRTHTKSIYAKLGVNDRRAAVRRAGELGLLPRP